MPSVEGLSASSPLPEDSSESDLQAAKPTPPGIPHCVEQQERSIGRRLLYITTLDGRLSALDIAKSGKQRWSIETGPGPLISSSIHRLELTNNGQFVRMIPSLSGGIYKFDGDSIDPIPITAENLLSSSAKFSDDLVISGGKETRNYGVSVRTGQLLYECSINGCVNATNEERVINDTISAQDKNDHNEEHADEELRDEDGYIVPHNSLLDDVIVVRRQTQTVRAVESRTGIERWNFSVGQHELNLIRADDCHEEPRSDIELAVLDVDIRVVVPEGIVCAFSKSDPQLMLWKHQFSNPIVSVWHTNEADELESIDLFGSAHWQAEQHVEGKPIHAPSIYLGMYEKQLYIQESIRLREEIMFQSQQYQQLSGDTSSLPRIPWRPIAASKNSLVLFQNERDQVIISEDYGRNELVRYDDQNLAVAAQSVLNASEFVNGNGFYFYTDSQLAGKQSGKLECGANETPTDLPAIEKPPSTNEEEEGGKSNAAAGNQSINDDLGFSLDDIDAPVKVIILSLWFWWKEIVVIAFTSAVLLNMFMGHRNQRVEREYFVIERHVPVQTAIEATEASTQALLGPVQSLAGNHHQQRGNQHNNASSVRRLQRSISESTTNSGEHFISRFQSDFDLMQCLGRGGFGVVFEAKNKLDENHYAIKRITLPNKESSRQRVLREARTLASCEHQNIVRYFHSWVETPPVGWQEEEDRKLLAHEMSTSIQIETPDGSTMPSFPNHPHKKHHDLASWVSDTVNSTACSNDYGHGDKSFSRIAKYNEDDDDDSLIEFRSESQSAALHADEIDLSEEQPMAPSNEIQQRTQPTAVSIDVHSESFDLKNINYTQHQLSNSFQIESVRSKGNSSGTDDDAEISPRRKPSTLALHHTHNNHNHNQQMQSQSHSNQIVLSNSTTQNGNTAKPNKVYLYIQMQLCRKESLRDWLRDNRTEARAAHIAHIFHQIVDAVEYVHLKGLIHRDLKPSNIFFSKDGQIKIGDFGLVTDMADIPNILNDCGDQSGLPSCARHTQLVGTHLYMSPEQLRGQNYDYKVDIYSLGLIFFELHVYFSTEMERIKTLRALRDGHYPEDFVKQHPEQYELLQRMLSSQPAERPQTNQLKQQLHEILQLPERLVDGHSEQAAMEAATRRLSRSRTFSSNSEQHQ
ncbi:hypothetical protein AWZ03_007419 [Drosophila navojoa]|uniref:non-specific serine/threonine protein kinase n=2 Tax=Drosophila navojoa TaxID=7232 RepID=A0A484BEI4_DRONA|nr:hypothetical protein AWZ03_007419 [Drosophila navojoa]